jgi:hypothetical protein
VRQVKIFRHLSRQMNLAVGLHPPLSSASVGGLDYIHNSLFISFKFKDRSPIVTSFINDDGHYYFLLPA